VTRCASLCVQSGYTGSIRVVGEGSSERPVLDRRWTYEFPRYYVINDRVDRHGKERHNGRRASPCGCTGKGWPAFDQGRGQQGQRGHCKGYFSRGNPTSGEKLEGRFPAQHGERGGIVVIILYFLRAECNVHVNHTTAYA
jgi:hypothetical protein